jgi:hypothetical protein
MAKGTELAKTETFVAIAPYDPDADHTGFDRRDVMKENLGAGGLDPTKLDRVKIPAGGGTAWEIPTLDGKGDIAKSLEVIIVAAQDVRSYYATEYDGSKNPPDCASLDTVTGSGEPGGQCRDCPKSKWGTAVDKNNNPTDGQACDQRKMMLCITKDSTLPFVVSIPPGSLGNINKYFMRLAGANLYFWAAVTNLSLKKTDSGGGIPYSVVVPEYVRSLSKEEIEGIIAYREGLGPMFNALAAERD